MPIMLLAVKAKTLPSVTALTDYVAQSDSALLITYRTLVQN